MLVRVVSREGIDDCLYDNYLFNKNKEFCMIKTVKKKTLRSKLIERNG